MKLPVTLLLGTMLGITEIQNNVERFTAHVPSPVLLPDENTPKRVEKLQVKCSARRVRRNLKRIDDAERSAASCRNG